MRLPWDRPDIIKTNYPDGTSYVEVKSFKYELEYKYKEQPKQGRIVIPMNRCNIWNMDTGGGFEGRLTIMDVDTKEFWQSDDLRTLYPNEKGR